MLSQVFVCSQGYLPLPSMHHWSHDQRDLPSWVVYPPAAGSALLGDLHQGSPPPQTWSTGGQYASYWNAYLYFSVDERTRAITGITMLFQIEDSVHACLV